MMTSDPTAARRRHFPEELRALPQWCAAGFGPEFFDDGKPNPSYKAPIDPKTGRAASTTDPRTWGTFEQATTYAEVHSLPFVGFVFTTDDPFAVVDLDTYKATDDQVRQLHAAILAENVSYAELSRSGAGTHIIGYGRLLTGVNNRPNCLEMYSSVRFLICTGNTTNNQPVCEIQELLDKLNELVRGSRGVDRISWRDLDDGAEGTLTDADLVAKISGAENGDKFDALCAGDISGHGNDWSVADAALIQFLCFYTPDNVQVARIFMMSKLAERAKAQRPDYVPRTIVAMRAKLNSDTLPPVDASVLVARAKAVAQQDVPMPAVDASIDFPDGLVGEVGRYVLASSTRPVHEIALATGIAVVAGIAGRSYNVSTPATGLNQYMLLLAATGTGKETIHASVDRLFHEVRKTVPAAMDFLGPAKFASGPALVKHFGKYPCFVSIMGEFGETIRQMTNPRGSPADQTLRQVMLDVYAKSGWGQSLRMSVYSDAEKNTSEVASPALTILSPMTSPPSRAPIMRGVRRTASMRTFRALPNR